jgi:predicted GH43/DUF377 family glycosyl hydrolase
VKWQNRGLIFDVTPQKNEMNRFFYAQGPQPIDLGEVIRVYFSSRVRDVNGKFLSKVNWVEFESISHKPLRISEREVIALGELGTYDEHGIFPFNVIQYDSRFIGYVSGWSRRSSVSVTTSIGVAIGNSDGTYFEKRAKGPCLTASANEPFLIGDPNVKYLEGEFHMWYIFGIKWSKTADSGYERTYRIGHAISHDGVTWQRPSEGIQIIPALNDLEAQAMPSVIQLERNLYFMVFCYRNTFGFRENHEKAYKLGAAISSDLIQWERNDNLVAFDSNSWSNEMACYPNLLEKEDKILLYMNGNSFGLNGFGMIEIEKETLVSNAKL